mmetsp:Transcript_15720/g.33238  ORF Transcript_15720/g.33238 Transcript_15720/m.33238 type:complete len:211 (-) Transcript_15720:229-861(-)
MDHIDRYPPLHGCSGSTHGNATLRGYQRREWLSRRLPRSRGGLGRPNQRGGRNHNVTHCRAHIYIGTASFAVGGSEGWSNTASLRRGRRAGQSMEGNLVFRQPHDCRCHLRTVWLPGRHHLHRHLIGILHHKLVRHLAEISNSRGWQTLCPAGLAPAGIQYTFDDFWPPLSSRWRWRIGKDDVPCNIGNTGYCRWTHPGPAAEYREGHRR